MNSWPYPQPDWKIAEMEQAMEDIIHAGRTVHTKGDDTEVAEVIMPCSRKRKSRKGRRGRRY